MRSFIADPGSGASCSVWPHPVDVMTRPERLRRTVRGMRPVFLTVVLALLARPAAGHPAPFSYVDLRLDEGRLGVTLTAHDIDLAYELGLERPDVLRDQALVDRHRADLVALVHSRLSIRVNGRQPDHLTVVSVDALAARDSVRFQLEAPTPAGRSLDSVVLDAVLFPYDPVHQTFVNVFEDGSLAHQAVIGAGRPTLEYQAGTPQGRAELVARFLASGVHHILIGPDHILFLVGLLLIGGGTWPLLRIVTAFTLAHSITLTLAALDVVAPPSHLVEPAIALSIVYVGTDNLLKPRHGRDVRTAIAFGFGLVHGFGFAYMLKAFDIPRDALAWSLASFNVGVELGQLAIVGVVAAGLAVLQRHDPRQRQLITMVGSVAVIGAGLYWFFERVLPAGGLS